MSPPPHPPTLQESMPVTRVSPRKSLVVVKQEHPLDPTHHLAPPIIPSTSSDNTSATSEDSGNPRSSHARYPFEVVDVTADASSLNQREVVLSKFFRCFHFPTTCAFHSNDPDEFVTHMKEKHPGKMFKCHYCGAKNTESFFDVGGLFFHIKTYHSARRLQCNLCFYRASRFLHLHLHMIECHPDNYNRAMETKKSMQTSSEPNKAADVPSSITKSLSSARIDVKPAARVLLCPIVVATFPIEDEATIFSRLKTARLNVKKSNQDVDLSHDYQCVFCAMTDPSKEFILRHLAREHADLPILYYIPGAIEYPQKAVQETWSVDVRPSVMMRRQEINQVLHPSSSGGRVSPGIPGLDSAKNHVPLRRTTIEVIPDEPTPATDDIVRKPSTSTWDDVHDNEMYIEEDGVDVQEDLALSEDDDSAFSSESKHIAAPTTPSKATQIGTPGRRTPKRQRIDDDSSDEEVISRKRRSQIESSNPVQSIQAVPKAKANPNIKHKKCLLCSDEPNILESKIQFHMMRYHNTTSTIKCGDCEVLGTKMEVKDHIKKDHKGIGKVVMIMVPVDDKEPMVIDIMDLSTSGKTRKLIQLDAVPLGSGPSTRRSTSTSSYPKTPTRRNKNIPPPKGHLMAQIKDSTFMGPLKNDKTPRLRIASAEEVEPSTSTSSPSKASSAASSSSSKTPSFTQNNSNMKEEPK